MPGLPSSSGDHGPASSSLSWAGPIAKAIAHSSPGWQAAVDTANGSQVSGLVNPGLGRTISKFRNRRDKAFERSLRAQRLAPDVATGSVAWILPLDIHSRPWCWWGWAPAIPTCSPCGGARRSGLPGGGRLSVGDRAATEWPAAIAAPWLNARADLLPFPVPDGGRRCARLPGLAKPRPSRWRGGGPPARVVLLLWRGIVSLFASAS